MIINWSFEFRAKYSESAESMIITSMIRTLSAFSIFGLFVLSKNVRNVIIKPYKSLEVNANDAAPLTDADRKIPDFF